jgi:hypothetical protein
MTCEVGSSFADVMLCYTFPFSLKMNSVDIKNNKLTYDVI